MRFPTHFVGRRKTGSNNNETTVICQERINIVVTTRTSETTLLTTPESVPVNACCAPMTSELIREISAPVCVRVKKAMDCRWMWAKTWERKS